MSPDESEYSIAEHLTVGPVILSVKVEVDAIARFIHLMNQFVA